MKAYTCDSGVLRALCKAKKRWGLMIHGHDPDLMVRDAPTLITMSIWTSSFSSGAFCFSRPERPLKSTTTSPAGMILGEPCTPSPATLAESF